MIIKINLQNLSILIIVYLFLVLACGGNSIGKNNGVERGRLKYDFGFYVNGKKWSPKGDENLSKRINWCDTSPNPQVEILRYTFERFTVCNRTNFIFYDAVNNSYFYCL